MIKIENVEIHGWEPAIRGMRNPKNSWDRSDSTFKEVAEIDVLDENGKPKKQQVLFDAISIGPNDMNLMMRLKAGGPVHAKYRRMIVVYADITAPLYWWKEYDTYKVGTVANSCSTMHKLTAKKFEVGDFSHEDLMTYDDVYNTEDAIVWCEDCDTKYSPMYLLETIIDTLNLYRERYLETKDIKYWKQMIQLLPSSYNQKRTVMLTYEVLANIDEWRHNHKLGEWRVFCQWLESLPYAEIITREKKEK